MKAFSLSAMVVLCCAFLAFVASGVVMTDATTTTPRLNYTTWKNDNERTGQQRNETLLTPSNVNSTKFGVKFSVSLDGMVFAQPLYMSGLTINGVLHNVVFVATEHDSVYAFDADTFGAPLWKKSFLINGATTVPQANVGSTVYTEVGITGTPVIDAGTGTLYVVAETLESGVYVHRLHALDVTTGDEQFGGPKTIAPSGFASKEQLQRPGLAIANGNVYVAFGSQRDIQPYHGWVIAYAETTLAQTAAWDVTPGGSAGGIWGGGGGLSADSNGDIYVSTGNGSFNKTTQFSMSIVKLSPLLTVLDWFAPWDAVTQSNNDQDVSAGGVLVVPDQSGGAFPHELIECAKLPQVYVLDRDNLGHQGVTSDSQIVQELTNIVGGAGTSSTHVGEHCFTTPAYWEGNLYFAGNNDVIKQFTLDPSTGKMSTAPTAKGSYVFTFPGGQPVTSSNGSTNGIVWVVDRGSPAHLHAFDATNVSHSLYTSGDLVFEKWAVPTVVNGKVYVAGQNKLFVFGLLTAPSPDFTVSASPSSQTVTQGGQTSYTATITAVGGFTGAVGFAASGLPSGATASFSPTSVSGSGSATLTVNTASSTPTGSYPIIITGTSGTLQHTAQVTLVVSSTGSADFSLSATPASRTIAQNAYNTYTVTVSPLNGFNGVVTFAASGLPTGATATFTPTSITGSGSTSMKISCVGTTVPGNYTVTITATSGSIQHTTKVALAVTGFSLSVSPTSRTVTRGSAVTYTATVTDLNGYSATKTMSVTGLPSGATATFSPSSISGSGTSTMTVQTATSTPTGTYTLSVRATSSIGSLYHTSVVSLSVQ